MFHLKSVNSFDLRDGRWVESPVFLGRVNGILSYFLHFYLFRIKCHTGQVFKKNYISSSVKIGELIPIILVLTIFFIIPYLQYFLTWGKRSYKKSGHNPLEQLWGFLNISRGDAVIREAK